MGVAVLKDRRSCLQVPKFDYLVNKQNMYNKLFYKTELRKGLVWAVIDFWKVNNQAVRYYR